VQVRSAGKTAGPMTISKAELMINEGIDTCHGPGGDPGIDAWQRGKRKDADGRSSPAMTNNSERIERCRYLFDFRFFDDFRFFAVFFFFAGFFGTFLPSALASERPIAIACLRLLTLRPERPLFSVPALRFFIARATLADAFLEYFRAMTLLPVAGK
jgi:hypothetical protein